MACFETSWQPGYSTKQHGFFYFPIEQFSALENDALVVVEATMRSGRWQEEREQGKGGPVSESIVTESLTLQLEIY